MKFRIFRTSNLYGDERPCSGAVEVGKNEWAVELSSLEELLTMVREYGKLILLPEPVLDRESAEIRLEIYDMWRE